MNGCKSDVDGRVLNCEKIGVSPGAEGQVALERGCGCGEGDGVNQYNLG